MDLQEQMIEVDMQAEIFKQALENGELKWDDEIIQFFLPLVLHFTHFDWLKLIAENNLVKEDEIVVKNFLDMVQSLMSLNQEQLEQQVEKKIERILREMGEL